MSFVEVGTIFAALMASFTGLAAYLASRRATSIEAAQRATDRTAELAAAEVAGWKTLIDSLMMQYKESAAEAAVLRAQGDLLKRQVAALTTAVAKMGGDVDLILRGVL